MKRLFLLVALFGVLAVGCENLLPNEQSPNSNAIFVTDCNDAYIIEVAGGELVVTITTNVDYSIVIHEEAKSWLIVADTRAEARMEKQTIIIAENNTFETRLANVEFVDDDGKVLKTILFSQKCDDKVFTTDAEGNYIVIAEGGEVHVAVTTNLEYSVAIPEEAQKWLSVADTRVEVREETLTFIVANNNSYDERSASVELVDSKGDVLQTIGFIQSAVEMCPSNEVWYTNGSTTEPTAPHNTYVFGANIVSNTFDAEKECWVIIFDGDVTTIGEDAFWNCSSLTSVTIPDSVTTIGDYAFGDCSNLTEFKGKFASEDGRCLIIDGTLNSFAIGCGVTGYTIPDSVITIGDYAFAYCRSLISVTIGDSVTSIGDDAFFGCSSLREFNGKYASEDGRCLIIDGTLNSFAPAGLTEYTIPDSVTTIGDYAFYDCYSLTSITIPGSVTIIGDSAFSGCSSLTSVTIPDIVTTIGKYAFYGCTGELIVNCNIPSVSDYYYGVFYGSIFTSVTIGDSVTEIGDYAFYNCWSLTSVTIGDSVTTIGDCAFYDCYSLTSVTIPDSVTTIGVRAFMSCDSLTSVIIPDSVTTIGAQAFMSCYSLTSVYCKAITPPTAILDDFGYWDAFNFNASGRKIYVPMKSVEAYKSADGWSEYAYYIVGYEF